MAIGRLLKFSVSTGAEWSLTRQERAQSRTGATPMPGVIHPISPRKRRNYAKNWPFWAIFEAKIGQKPRRDGSSLAEIRRRALGRTFGPPESFRWGPFHSRRNESKLRGVMTPVSVSGYAFLKVRGIFAVESVSDLISHAFSLPSASSR